MMGQRRKIVVNAHFPTKGPSQQQKSLLRSHFTTLLIKGPFSNIIFHKVDLINGLLQIFLFLRVCVCVFYLFIKSRLAFQHPSILLSVLTCKGGIYMVVVLEGYLTKKPKLHIGNGIRRRRSFPEILSELLSP